MKNHTRVICAAIGFVCAAIGIAIAQDTGVLPRFPILVSEIAAPAIDRGIREFDPARPPRTEGTALRVAAAAEPFLRGSLIVKFRPGTSPDAQRAMLSQVNGALTAPLSYANFDIVSIAGTADPEAAARLLDAQPDVEYAQARYRVYPQFVPNDPMYSRQWNYPALGMEAAWDINPGATSSVTVAVLDTGVAFRSAVMQYNAEPFVVGRTLFPALGRIEVPFAAAPDLGGPGRFVAPRDFIWETTTPMDLEGHGTHVAGTIGQLTNNGMGVAGMAFNVRLMPIKVLTTDWDVIFGAPVVGTDDVVARAVRYAADNGADVINLSIGRFGAPAPVVQEALFYAVSRGVFIAVAAGNDFLTGNRVDRLAEIAPQLEGMVSVGAISRNRRRAIYSSTGNYVELAAPGGDQFVGAISDGILQQTYDLDLVETYLSGPAQYRAPRFDAFTYEFFQGTSMAAPHVAGFAALLIQQGITKPAAIEAVMKRYATDLGTAGRDNEFGYGLINPRASLRGLGLAK